MIANVETRYLTASEKGEQDEQCWRAARIKQRRAAEAAQAQREAWMKKIGRAA